MPPKEIFVRSENCLRNIHAESRDPVRQILHDKFRNHRLQKRALMLSVDPLARRILSRDSLLDEFTARIFLDCVVFDSEEQNGGGEQHEEEVGRREDGVPVEGDARDEDGEDEVEKSVERCHGPGGDGEGGDGHVKEEKVRDVVGGDEGRGGGRFRLECQKRQAAHGERGRKKKKKRRPPLDVFQRLTQQNRIEVVVVENLGFDVESFAARKKHKKGQNEREGSCDGEKNDRRDRALSPGRRR